jgi:hypothetical protein
MRRRENQITINMVNGGRVALLICLMSVIATAQSVPPRKDIPAIAKAASGAIVTIVMANDDKPIAQGTGFVVNADGVIVTNYHVIESGNVAIVKFSDGRALPVEGVMAANKARDLAVIKIRGQNFRVLTLGNSDRLQIGEEIVAIGNPLGLELTVSNGILSGVRTAEKEGGKYLQITAPISHGSSGGPLFNMAGEVVGITSMAFKGGENLNFAIPINDAKGLVIANSSKLQSLPNELEPANTRRPQPAPKTHEADAPRSASFEQKVACANVVEKNEKEEREFEEKEKLNWSMTMSSHFDRESSICFEVMTRYSASRKTDDGKQYEHYQVFIKDAVERKTYALIDTAWEVRPNSFVDDQPAGGYFDDINGKSFSLKGLTIKEFWDLADAKFGIKEP